MEDGDGPLPAAALQEAFSVAQAVAVVDDAQQLPGGIILIGQIICPVPGGPELPAPLEGGGIPDPQQQRRRMQPQQQ